MIEILPGAVNLMAGIQVVQAPSADSGMMAVVIDGATALATMLATGFAAFSVWIGRKAAKAAQDTVNDARTAREESIRPRLTFVPVFNHGSMSWPSAAPANTDIVMEGRDASGNATALTFLLENHGSSPALELTVIFDLEDGADGLEFPSEFSDIFAPTGRTIRTELEAAETPPYWQIWLMNGSQGSGFPLYKRWTVELPLCAADETVEVAFPEFLLRRLFVRGAQNFRKPVAGTADEWPTVLTVRVFHHSIEGTRAVDSFRFSLLPFVSSMVDGRGQIVALSGAFHFHRLARWDPVSEPKVAG